MSEKELRQIIATRIQVHRKAMGLKQSELAERAGASQGAIADAENARKNASLLTILKLSHVFGVEPHVLLTKVSL